MTFRAHVRVMPRRGLLDPQGQAVEHALKALKFENASHVHVGKAIEFNLDADSPEAARVMARTMCEKLLANPVTEDFEITVEAG